MNFDKSIELYERSRRSLSGGISSNIRAASYPVPLFYKGGKGAHIFDVDGNKYIDYCLGQGPLLLGHSHPRVIEAVKQQLDIGQLYAGQHEHEIIVSEKLQRFIPCADMVRFSNSGSEAVHIALRLARAFTGKEKIVKFHGHYHGWFDNILVNVDAGPEVSNGATKTRLETKGQTSSALQEVIALPWNNAEAVRQVLEERADEIAAVIMEPIMCNIGCILPKPGYLKEVRELCTRNNVVLIFDEVITGFRLGLSGAQGFFGTTPDLATFGKAVGSGFPISCLVGRKELMNLIADLSVVHAGTYNSNPVCMAAIAATLEKLEEADGATYRTLFKLGQTLMDNIRDLAKRKGHNLRVQGIGPMFHLAFTDGDQLADYDDYLKVDKQKYFDLANALQDRGVRVIHRGIWYLSSAHTEDDIDITVKALSRLL